MQFTGQKAEQPASTACYWSENVIDWLGKWRPTCVMRHARGQKLQSFRRKWPFYMDLYSMPKGRCQNFQGRCKTISVEVRTSPHLPSKSDHEWKSSFNHELTYISSVDSGWPPQCEPSIWDLIQTRSLSIRQLLILHRFLKATGFLPEQTLPCREIRSFE
jgi:hypothetical protein